MAVPQPTTHLVRQGKGNKLFPDLHVPRDQQQVREGLYSKTEPPAGPADRQSHLAPDPNQPQRRDSV